MSPARPHLRRTPDLSDDRPPPVHRQEADMTPSLMPQCSALPKLPTYTRFFFFSCAFVFTGVYLFRYFRHPYTVHNLQLASSEHPPSDTLAPATIRHQLSLLTAHSPVLSPSPAPNDVCLFLSPDPASPLLWTSNAQSLCVTSPLCLPISPNGGILHTTNFSQTTCRMVTPQYHPLPPTLEDPKAFDPSFYKCAKAQRRMQLCPLPNGTFRLGAFPACLSKQPAPQNIFGNVMHKAADKQTIFEGITIIVPSYPYPANIYHFAAAMATIGHIASNLHTILSHFGSDRIVPTDAQETLPLNVLFMGFRRLKMPWGINLLTALLEGRIASVLPKGVKITYLPELVNSSSKYACVRNPINMGQRGHVNAWPFANSTQIRGDGSQVPRDSIGFRDDVYKYVGINVPPMHKIDEVEDSDTGGKFGKIMGRISVPPLVLGYSKRQGENTTSGKGVHKIGALRRFSDEDDQWFTEMLTNETTAVGVELQIFTPSPDESFQVQVQRMIGIGFVVGIHGANMVNSLFMRPFGVLFEIFPANMDSMCYKAGSNSGLAYFQHHAIVEATPEESGCAVPQTKCQALTRQRRVKISTDEDRKLIRNNVQAGLRHIIHLNNEYANQGGVPVVYNWVTGTYDIAGWKSDKDQLIH